MEAAVNARSALRASDPVLHGLIDARPNFDALAWRKAVPVQDIGALLIACGADDVLIAGDLVLRKAVQRAYRLAHRASENEVNQIGARWAPHRTLAGAYLFDSLTPMNASVCSLPSAP